MNRALSRIVCLLGVLAVLGGCASGPSYKKISATLPALSPDKGRIFLYRDGSPFGSAIQPHIYVNDDMVGHSKPGGFFYVDRPPGNYEISCRTEARHALTIALTPGETVYVRTRVTMGLGIGQVWPILESQKQAMKTLSSSSYTASKNAE